MKNEIEKFEGVRVISLGGFGQVTGNMFLYETEKDILVVDCGVSFPTGKMLGVDLTIPDVSYLLAPEKLKKLKGIIISHGHDDHMAALPYILPKLPKVPVFGSRWALALVKNKLEEFHQKVWLEEVGQGKRVSLGDFSVEFVEVTHSVPETLHLIISSPAGIFYHAADFKLDLNPVMGRPSDQKLMSEMGKKGVLCLLSDCLNAEREGFTPPEAKLSEVFQKAITSCQGGFWVTMMSSNISRIKQAIDVSIGAGRQVVLVGRSVEKNMELALRLGYLRFPSNVFLPVRQAERKPPSSLTFIVAGSQAQAGSALERVAGGQHRLKIGKKDKIVFSTDAIPGNELAVYHMVDDLCRLGAEVVYADVLNEVHVSGHGSSGDLRKLIQLIKPEFLLPIGGNYRHMIAYQKMAIKEGYSENHVLLPDDGQTLRFLKSKQVLFDKKVPVKSVMVDALGVGDVGNVVLRDRQVLSEEGIVVILMIIETDTQSLVKDPEILTRGFVFVKTSESLLRQAEIEAKRVFLKTNKGHSHLTREEVQGALEKFFFEKTGRRPMILTQFIEL